MYRSHSGRKKAPPHILDSSTLAQRKKSGNFLDTTIDKYHSEHEPDTARKIERNLADNLERVCSTEPADIMTDSKFSFYKEAFVEVLEQNTPYRELLQKIKQAYDSKLTQIINEKKPIFNSSPSTYELVQEELVEMKTNLEQEKQEKQSLSRRVEEMAEEMSRLHSFCDSQDLYLKQLKDKNEVLKKKIIQAKMSHQIGGGSGGATQLLNELEHLYEKCNQQQQLLARYKEELKRSKNQELIYMSILKKENESSISQPGSSMYFGSPNRPIFRDMKVSPNPKSAGKFQIPQASLIDNNFREIKPEEEQHPRASSAMRVDQIVPSGGLYEKEDLNRKYSYSPEPSAISQPRKKVVVPKLDFSKLRESNYRVVASKKKAAKSVLQNENTPFLGEKAKQIPNSTVTIQDLLNAETKPSASNVMRTSANEFPSKENRARGFDIFSKNVSPVKPKNKRNQELNPYDYTQQSANKTNYSSSECSENLLNSSKSNPKPVIPKINPGFIVKKNLEKAKTTKPTVPNLVSKISQIKGIDEPPKGFHQEFMENFQEFSESWRKQTRHMQRRFSQQP